MNPFRPHFSDRNSAVELQPLAGDIDFHRLGYLLRAKAALIAAIAGAIFVGALIYVLFATRIYESRAVIQVLQEPQKVVDITEVSEEKPETIDYLNTVVQAFTSRKLLLRVIRSTELSGNPSFAPPEKADLNYHETELADRLSRMVDVSLRRGTRLVDVKVFHQDPQTAKVIATALVDEFLQAQFEQRRELSRLANKFLHQEAEELKAKLESAERDLQSYKEKTKAVSLEERQDVIVEKLREVNKAATDAKNLRLRLEADLEQMRTINPKDVDGLLKISSVSRIPQVALIREKLLEAQNELANVKDRYLPLHPKRTSAQTKVADLKSELASVLSKAGGIVERDYESAREAERKLDESLQEQEQKALDLNKIAIPYNVLQREIESDRALFQSVTHRLKETNITGNVDSPSFRVIEEPLVPASPTRPRKIFVLGLALALGITLGVGTVIGRDGLDGSLRTLDEAESYLERPVLAAIPDSREAVLSVAARTAIGTRSLLRSGVNLLKRQTIEESNHPLVIVDDKVAEQAEAFRTLRASISLFTKSQQFRSFLFTSAIPSEGKTFTSLNFACALARHNRKTLIIDADLREPGLNEVLLGSNENEIRGLTDVLRGEIPLGNALKQTSQQNLLLLPAGRRVPDPAELLDGQEFARIVGHLMSNFDRVVIDSPPVNAVSDVLLIAAFAQATCLVVRAGRTPKKAIFRALQQLEMSNANVVGLVLNRLPIGGPGAGYFYYQYGSGYGRNRARRQSESGASVGLSTTVTSV